ncbi:hypothetical protein P22_3060 [Propionispora sp. 2/2-37]|nr:hypothetical protein P22_3060 [Propionispora sp. 2/2-37]
MQQETKPIPNTLNGRASIRLHILLTAFLLEARYILAC